VAQSEAISRSALSYQVKFGASYLVSKKTNLFLENSYLKITELTFEEMEGTLKPDTVSYKAGFRYTF